MEKPLPTLDQVTVASPCHVDWGEMTGDDRMRFCSQCQLHVYDLSAMGRDEATAFIGAREGRKCVRFFRRQDGTILTRDCPVGLRAVRQRFMRAVAALIGLGVALLGGTLFGSRLNRLKPEGFRSPSETFAHWVDPQEEILSMTMGVIVCPPTNPSPPSGVFVPILDEPAETPLPPPTAEQLDAIQQRLIQ